MKNITLSMVNDIKVVVPDSLNLITTYVLQEQQDWFESEIKFVRQLLKEGQKVIDIGANCGVYSLSMAKAVGEQGHVWAFEPASETASRLRQGVELNGFSNVSVLQKALSNVSGTAYLSLQNNSELNALVKENINPLVTEEIELVTLDQALVEYGWESIDFMKIDAEGEELNIIKGGGEFFDKMSPLVMYEIKKDVEFDVGITKAFEDIGYDSYYLIPSLNVLVPFVDFKKIDPFMLNVFCCKLETAMTLKKQGLLIFNSSNLDTGHLWEGAIGSSPIANTLWGSYVANYPYAKLFFNIKKTSDMDQRLLQALNCYAYSQISSEPIDKRFLSLKKAYQQLNILVSEGPMYLRLLSFARVAFEFGRQAEALSALHKQYQLITDQKYIYWNEPFLLPSREFDIVKPTEDASNWLMASIYEALEYISSYSSFFTGLGSQPRLLWLKSSGFASAEMLVRLELIQKRFGIER